MRLRRWFALVLAVALVGCVKQSDFDVYKAGIIADGEAVDTWIAQAHLVVKWVADNAATICPPCGPPTAPPSPPPNGKWGA